MASKTILPLKILSHTGTRHTGTVFFLHGSGDTGVGVSEWVNFLYPEFLFPHLKIIFPSAPPQPYTPNDGLTSTVWFDRKAVSKRVPEDIKSIDKMAEVVTNLIKREVDSGIPINRIVIGGFSMGGAMALHIAYRHLTEVAGVFALGSFINDGSILYENLSTPKKFPPLFQWHGVSDDLVPIEWGKETHDLITSFNVKGQFYRGENALHELKKECLMKLHSWISVKIPES